MSWFRRVSTPPSSPEAVQLPNWTDAASVITYLTSGASLLVSLIALSHPGFTEPAVWHTYIPIIGYVIAAGAQFYNVHWHRSIQKAAILARIALGK